MSHKFLEKSSFHWVLWQIDHSVAEEKRCDPCPYCGGKLHKAHYPRSPLGVSPDCRQHYDKRFSLCCGTCRKRIRIPSVRFMGRRRFPSAIFLIIALLRHPATKKLLKTVRRYFGISISLRTWKRWRHWWKECFMTTHFWKQIEGTLPSVIRGCFPRTLYCQYHGKLSERIVKILQFLSPLTAGHDHAV